MQHPLTARREASPVGVIETLSAGYAAVNRQAWVLLLPVALNLFLWLGPHVSYSPLIGPAVTDATEWTRQVPLLTRRGFRNADVVGQLEQSRQAVIASSDDVNGLSALAWGPLALPSLASLPSPTENFAFVNSWVDGLTLLVACLGLGLLLGGWYYGGLALASTGEHGGPLAAGRNIPRAVLDVLGLVVVLSAATLLLAAPVLLLIGFTAFVSPPVALLAAVLLMAGVIFAAIHLFFAVDAIFVSGAGPMAAIQRSVVLVRRHLWQSVALILLTWLILAGMDRVWDVLAANLQNPYGAVLGILGNAYVASGLIAAGMIFYTQRSEQVVASGAPIPA
jgi:hypothetical protein